MPGQSKQIDAEIENAEIQCHICAKAFIIISLKRHQPIHASYRRYICNICGYRFTLKSDLNRHLQIHNEEKPYSCTYCQKRFYTTYAIARHETIHTDVKPYCSKLCGNTFRRLRSSKRHVTSNPYKYKESKDENGRIKDLEDNNPGHLWRTLEEEGTGEDNNPGHLWPKLEEVEIGKDNNLRHTSLEEVGELIYAALHLIL